MNNDHEYVVGLTERQVKQLMDLTKDSILTSIMKPRYLKTLQSICGKIRQQKKSK